MIVDIGTGEHDQGEPLSTMTRAFSGWIGSEPARPGGLLVDIGHAEGSDVVTVSRKPKLRHVKPWGDIGRWRAAVTGTDRTQHADRVDGGSDGLVRALRVLETLAGMRQPASLPAITARTGLSKTKAYRVLRILQDGGYVDQPVEVVTGSEAAASASPR